MPGASCKARCLRRQARSFHCSLSLSGYAARPNKPFPARGILSGPVLTRCSLSLSVDSTCPEQTMKGNIPIPELPSSEEVWLMVAVTSVRERRTQQGKPFREASARNATGTLALKIWADVLEAREDLKPGLWGVTGRLDTFQNQTQFVVTEYKPITI